MCVFYCPTSFLTTDAFVLTSLSCYKLKLNVLATEISNWLWLLWWVEMPEANTTPEFVPIPWHYFTCVTTFLYRLVSTHCSLRFKMETVWLTKRDSEWGGETELIKLAPLTHWDSNENHNRISAPPKKSVHFRRNSTAKFNGWKHVPG